ncbi:MAG: helix-turn-helix transcriptional regulator, partial [Methanobrevibacter sp.]|nr:helix-turn-helix transcriptional regulator [Methanobrevibacter sp.]
MFLVNLDRLIESQGMSKNEFSKKVGIAPSTISSWYNKGGLFKMIINKEQITIDKFEVRLYNKTYLILTYEKSKDGFTEFYITE